MSNNLFYKDLNHDKIKMNWNKNPIKMDEFLSFLTVSVTKSKNHFGVDTGWTQYNGDDNLIITGGVVGRVEYLDHLQYGKKLHNDYNNFVNPFFLFDILNKEGQEFFLNYYKDEIEKLISEANKKVMQLQAQLNAAKNKHDDLVSFWEPQIKGEK
jgi:hypothetical protein